MTLTRLGAGTITSSPAALSCGATCLASFAKGTAVTLTATPDTGYAFGGWTGGGCTGTAACTTTLEP
ncbi:InlB B-repeat-containing protein, partial [Corallococcus terminator]